MASDEDARELGAEAYGRLKQELSSAAGDPQAVASLLDSAANYLQDWIRSAYDELRQALVQARLDDGEEIGLLIGVVLNAQDGEASGELAEGRIHEEAMRSLVAGIGDVLGSAHGDGIRQLEHVTEAVYCEDSLQWLAWFWISKASAARGDIDGAWKAAQRALSFVERLDLRSQAAARSNAGEMEWLAGDHELAQSHFEASSKAFEEIDDRRGAAMVWLSWAQKQAEQGESARAAQAATRANALDPESEEPVLFLAGEAFLAGNHEFARSLLFPFLGAGDCSTDVSRLFRLIDLHESGAISHEAMRHYVRLRERPPSQETIRRLKELWEAEMGFLHLRELLAWQLTWVGDSNAAALHFEALAAQQKEEDVRSSAELGLACLASRMDPHRKPGRWVHGNTAHEELAAGEAEANAPAELTGSSRDRSGADADAQPDHVEPDHVASDALAEIEFSALEPPVAQAATAGSWAAAAARPPRKRPSVEEVASSAKAAFTGELETLPVPDLLEFLKASRRTGTLILTSEQGIGAVHLRGGMITSAASPHGIGIGQVLLERGAVEEAQLREASEAQDGRREDTLLGAILVKRGHLDEASVKDALRQQIYSAIIELVGWDSGRFAFEADKPGEQAGDEGFEIELDTQALLLDALREVDEQNR